MKVDEPSRLLLEHGIHVVLGFAGVIENTS